MRIFISYGFILIMSTVGLITVIILTGIKSGNFYDLNTFDNGLMTGILITIGLVMMDKGMWVGKKEEDDK